jgi:hypothetical protein
MEVSLWKNLLNKLWILDVFFNKKNPHIQAHLHLSIENQLKFFAWNSYCYVYYKY